MPENVKRMLAEAGVLDEVPFDGSPPPEPSSFIRPPPPTFDWQNPGSGDAESDDDLFQDRTATDQQITDAQADAYLQHKLQEARAALAQDGQTREDLGHQGEQDAFAGTGMKGQADSQAGAAEEALQGDGHDGRTQEEQDLQELIDADEEYTPGVGPAVLAISSMAKRACADGQAQRGCCMASCFSMMRRTEYHRLCLVHS